MCGSSITGISSRLFPLPKVAWGYCDPNSGSVSLRYRYISIHWMTKHARFLYLSKLEKLAEDLYRRGDSVSHDNEWEKQRSFMYGFCDSGKTISLVTQEDIQRVIDKAHQRVYGEERLARKERLKPLVDESGEPDWDAFDSPTFERKAGN